ncbi:hypothetical protein [Methanobacterium sp. ACI-7]|uniref:hypothetical protein n=1 Tax=unclassified Methanobacterium TaxID=2627676 RepID=UPI0039C0081E
MANESNMSSLFIGFLFVMLGLLRILSNDQLFLAPILIALGITLIISTIFKNKKYSNRTFYNIIVAVILILMVIGEYLLVPTKNTLFYILILIMAIILFIPAYFFFIPENHRNKTEKRLTWGGLILFFIILNFLYGLVYNDFAFSLIIVAFILIIFTIILIIRKWRFGKVF